MTIKEIKCKSILTKSKLPGCDYVINPYSGCLMNCVYCYSRFIKRFTGHKEPWGSYADVKINAPEVLEKEIRHAKKGMIFLSSITDAYQPIEKKYKLTRKILKIILERQFPVAILTKSTLVLRDIDIFKKFNDITVGVSISSLDENIKDFEPVAASPKERIKILQTLHKNKINTYAHIGPILPGFTDLPKIFAALKGIVNDTWLESFNTKGENWTGVAKILKRKYPELLPKYEEIFFTKKKEPYLTDLKKEISNLSKKYNIETKFFVHGG